LEKIKDFDIEITDFVCFEKVFSSKEWNQIKDIKSEIERITSDIKKYEKSSDIKIFEDLFIGLNLDSTCYSSDIADIRGDIEKKGYDRHSKILRKINNISRGIRLGKIFSRLPREIVDVIIKTQDEDNTRNEQVKHINSLYNHCLYYENLSNLINMENRLKEKLSTCGVSDDEFYIIDDKIDNSKAENLDIIKDNILRVQQIKKELILLSKSESANKINFELHNAEKDRGQRVSVYIQNIINRSLLDKYDKNIVIRKIIGRIQKAFGKSKKAFKTFDKLRSDPDNFNAALDIIPIWIMELDDASRLLPLQSNMFDYVILDEASQCNIAYTMPTMFRAVRAIFVGDKEQMRDNTIMFKSNRVFDELAHRYQIPDERQIKAAGTSVQSLLHIADSLKFRTRMLKYHYRSPAELIGFSNENFYHKSLVPLNSNYLTYKDTNRVMLVHEVESDWSEEISDNINVAEAKAILGLFKELRSDEKYKDKSIGILSFFNAQATEIRKIFTEGGFKEENDNYKVSIIEGIQGDEKDIIIYSFVIRNIDQKRRYNPLTGEGGDIRGDINKGRVNVAFSRARMQVHCFVSMPIRDIPDKIWIKKYLEYATENYC
jgi:superfamily I DNA and/or RNA helicase